MLKSRQLAMQNSIISLNARWISGSKVKHLAVVQLAWWYLAHYQSANAKAGEAECRTTGCQITSSWSSRVAPRLTNRSTSLSLWRWGSSSAHDMYKWWTLRVFWNRWMDEPSSSFSRYFSNIGSSLTTCWAAAECIDARWVLNNLEEK